MYEYRKRPASVYGGRLRFRPGLFVACEGRNFVLASRLVA